MVKLKSNRKKANLIKKEFEQASINNLLNTELEAENSFIDPLDDLLYTMTISITFVLDILAFLSNMYTNFYRTKYLWKNLLLEPAT